IAIEKQKGISPAFHRIIRHCLEKEPEDRFQSARDLVFALETLTGQPDRGAKRPLRLTSVVPWAVAGLLAVALLLVGRQLHPASVPATFQRLTFDEGTIYSARFSPDGHTFVYGASWNGKPLRLYSAVGESLLSQQLDLNDASLLAISSTRELALVL